MPKLKDILLDALYYAQGIADRKATMLTNWGTILTGGDYTAPELRRLRLCGALESGKSVITSALEAKEGPRTYRTSSGSLYELSGDPDPAYVAYLQGIGRTLDLDDPIKGL